MHKPRKALVIGDDTRSFLATVRSLGRGGVEVHAAPFSFRSPALTSRYISKTHWIPYYVGEGPDWLEAIEELLRREQFAIVIPCDERSLLPLHHHRERFSTLTQLAIPDQYSLDVFFDKNSTRELARTLGIPIAKGRMIRATDKPDSLIAEAGLPLAIKPTCSYTLDRLYTRNRVTIASSKSEIADALTHTVESPHFFEAFFPGTGVGVSVLASRGRLLQAFQHRRVHEYQGASYYRVSEEPSAQLLDAVTQLIKATGYSGVAMFEFRVDNASGAWALLEVNARPWGSLPLPVALGADFPYRWYKLLVEGDETPALPYRVGVYGRNFVPDARQQFARARSIRGPLKLARFVISTLAEYMRFFAGREIYDILVRDDPRPAWNEAVDRFEEWRIGVFSSLPGSAQRSRRNDQLALRNAVTRTHELEIAFVCQGNICRSPIAAALLQRELEGETGIRVRSYGNLPRAGAPSPLNAIKAAEGWDVDLKDHRSKHFSLEAVRSAHLIVTFDGTNRNWIERRYPSAAAPIVRLGSFLSSPASDPIIADPDGCDLTQFERTYGGIADAIGGMAQQIRDARNG
jgi:protein-tyrosine-phosphatase/predicted ATP-grasp superfamily ATP-dependent carboligase